MVHIRLFFLPALLVPSLLVNPSFSIICISTPILQLVQSLSDASLFLLPCHSPTFQLLTLFSLCVPTSSFLLLFSCLWSISSLLEPLPSLPCYFLLMYLDDLLLFFLSASSLSPSWMCSSPHWLFWGTLISAAAVSVVTSWIWWNTFLPCCHVSPYLFTSTLLSKHCHATISFSRSYRISKLHCQLSVSFSTPMFFHKFTWSFRVGCSHIFNSWCASTSCDSYALVRSIYGD